MDLFLLLLVNGIANGSHYALRGLGFGLIFATTNVVHFAYGPVYASSAYIAWAGATALGLSLPVATALAVIGGAVIGGATYVGLYRPFEVRNAPVFVVLIVSLGLFIVLENLLGIRKHDLEEQKAKAEAVYAAATTPPPVEGESQAARLFARLSDRRPSGRNGGDA